MRAQKQPSILTVRRIQFWLQNTLRKASRFNFNIDKAKFIWSSSMTSTIYKIIIQLCQKRKTFSNAKESETKKEYEKQEIRKGI